MISYEHIEFNFEEYYPNIYTKVSFHNATPFFDINTFDSASWDSLFFIFQAPLDLSLNHLIRASASWDGTFQIKAEIDFSLNYSKWDRVSSDSVYIKT